MSDIDVDSALEVTNRILAENPQATDEATWGVIVAAVMIAKVRGMSLHSLQMVITDAWADRDLRPKEETDALQEPSVSGPSLRRYGDGDDR